MKMVLNGKMYDTETADFVAKYNNGFPTSDFKCVEEELYVSSKGQWFLKAFGGAMTEYAKPVGNMRSCNEFLKLLTEDEAKEWLERTGNTKAYVKHFSPQEG